MPRGACVAVLSCIVLSSVEPAYAECQTRLPPAAERAGYWQYRTVQGKRCWFGPLKTRARAQATVINPARVTPEPTVRATTDIEPLAKPPIIVPMPPLPVVTPDDDHEIWPKPDASFDQRFDPVRGR